jgi:hypothetical protein
MKYFRSLTGKKCRKTDHFCATDILRQIYNNNKKLMMWVFFVAEKSNWMFG